MYYDYKPFGGLEASGTNQPFSKAKTRLGYVNMPKDKESNLGDHGVRKYDSEVGRFLAIDPLWEKYHTLNPFQYSANSPVMMLDKNGMWTESVHNFILETIFGNNPNLDVYKTASKFVDTDQDDQNKHSMRNHGQSKEQARINAIAFVSSKLFSYISTGNEFFLGEGMHTLMDAESPSHEGFQVYNGSKDIEETVRELWLFNGKTGATILHIEQEMTNEQAKPKMDQMKSALLRYRTFALDQFMKVSRFQLTLEEAQINSQNFVEQNLFCQ